MRIFWLCLILIPTLAFSQPEPRQDSLFSVWQNEALHDTIRLDALYNFTWDYYLFSNPDSARYWANLQYAYARQADELKYAGQAVNLQAIAAMVKGEMEPVPDLLTQAIALFDSAHAKGASAGALGNLGTYYYRRGELVKAIEHHQRSLSIFEELGNTRGIANGTGNIGLIYQDMGRWGEANAYFFRALKLGEDIGDQQGIGSSLTAISITYENLKNYPEALAYAQRSFDLAEAQKDLVHMSTTLDLIGNIYTDQFEYDTAIQYYQASLEVAEKLEGAYEIAHSLSNLGNAYSNQGKYQQALPYFERALTLSVKNEDYANELLAKQNLGQTYLQLKQFPESLRYNQEAMAMARELQDIETEKLVAFSLYDYYKQTRQPAKALEMHELYLLKRDSLESEANQREALRYEYQYAYEKQILADSLIFVQEQAETELVFQQQLSQRNYLLLGGLGLALIGFIFFRYRSRQRALELQQERARKEQLDQVNQMKSRFFANISHEFRTPLTLVLGQNQQLQAELDDPRLDAKFDRVDRNGRRLLELVNQVLDLSKLEASNMALKTETIDLIPFLKNLLFSFESLADQKFQALIFDHNLDSLLIVADPEKLERIFYNLLANALKFTPERGRITLKLQMVANLAHIGIIDTGIGIPEAQVPYIFDRFYQAEGGTTHSSPGTGIGLALAKELVELHAGRISVQSVTNEGTEFWVVLPLSAGIEDLPVPYAPRLEPLEGFAYDTAPSVIAKTKDQTATNILIVEDNHDVRAYLKDELLGLGYQVDEATNGQEGLVRAKARQPDLIISDLMMPKMDGYEFTKAIRADMQSSHIPIIMLTAKASEESKLTGLKLGADAYLTKPFNRAELEIRVSKLIEQRTFLRQRFSESVSIRPEDVSAVPMDQVFLMEITALIESNLMNEAFGVENLSEAMAMSVTHLNRKLKALIGQSGGKLIRSMRMQRAADLLRQEASTISDIAYDLGFSSPTSFTRTFKAQFGVSPTEYTRQQTF